MTSDMYGVCAVNVKYSREMEDIFLNPEAIL